MSAILLSNARLIAYVPNKENSSNTSSDFNKTLHVNRLHCDLSTQRSSLKFEGTWEVPPVSAPRAQSIYGTCTEEGVLPGRESGKHNGDRSSLENRRRRPRYKSTKYVTRRSSNANCVPIKRNRARVRASSFHVRGYFLLLLFISRFRRYGLLWHRVSLYARFIKTRSSIFVASYLDTTLNIIHIER